MTTRIPGRGLGKEPSLLLLLLLLLSLCLSFRYVCLSSFCHHFHPSLPSFLPSFLPSSPPYIPPSPQFPLSTINHPPWPPSLPPYLLSSPLPRIQSPVLSLLNQQFLNLHLFSFLKPWHQQQSRAQHQQHSRGEESRGDVTRGEGQLVHGESIII
jgi:hypothetical protein